MPTLTSKDNKLIKTAVKLKKSAKFRKKTGLFVAEGVRICVNAERSCNRYSVCNESGR